LAARLAPPRTEEAAPAGSASAAASADGFWRSTERDWARRAGAGEWLRELDPEELPPGFAEALGPPPAHEQVVVFPIAGSERVIAIVYADNGDSARALRDVDLLEVAAAQVGIAFENELLRRQLGRTVV